MEYQKQWDFLRGKFEAGQLGHAYIFSGAQETDVKIFAKELTKLLSCENQKKFPCQICQRCLLIKKEIYPDLLVVTSANSKSSLENEKDMMEIDVAQIREINNFLSLKSYYNGFKTVIVEQAERMNTEAQSCFLKTLEEPKGKTLIILLSSKADTLLPTITSRCQTVKFFSPKQGQESLNDKDLSQEIISIINRELAVKFQYTKKANLEGENFGAILEGLARYFRKAMLAQLGVLQESLPKECANYSIEKFKKIITLIESLHRQFTTATINSKLALEILLLEI